MSNNETRRNRRHASAAKKAAKNAARPLKEDKSSTPRSPSPRAIQAVYLAEQAKIHGSRRAKRFALMA